MTLALAGADRDAMINELVRKSVPRSKAEAAVDEALGLQSRAAIEKSELDELAREKAVEAEGDRIMAALGFDVVRLSQARRSKIQPGLPDRRYRHHHRKLALWWEAKAEWGRQSPDQKAFQEAEEACGQVYVLGTHVDLLDWLQLHRVCRRERDGSITPLPIDEQR